MTTAYDVLETWRCVVLDALKSAGAPAIDTSYTTFGEVVDDDQCGQLVVSSIDRQYRATTFPIEDFESENCWVGKIVVPVYIRLTRCWPTVTEKGVPTPTQIAKAAEGFAADQAVIWNACNSDPLPSEFWERAGLAQIAEGPSGAVITGVTTMLISVPSSTWQPGDPETVWGT